MGAEGRGKGVPDWGNGMDQVQAVGEACGLVARRWGLTESDAECRCSLEAFAAVPWSLHPAVTSGSPITAPRTQTLMIEEKRMKI